MQKSTPTRSRRVTPSKTRTPQSKVTVARSRSRTPVVTPKHALTSRGTTPSKTKKKVLKHQSTMEITKKAALELLGKGSYIPVHRHNTRLAAKMKRTSKRW